LYKYIFPALILLCFPSHIIAKDYEAITFNDYYRFYYKNSDSVLVQKLISKVKPGLRLMDTFFQYSPESGIDIIISKSKDEYQQLAQVPIPEWSQAIAFTRQGKIILNLSSAEAIRSSPQILIHELTHIFLASVFPEAIIPVWINEGLAQYFAEEDLSFEDMRMLANALSSSKLLDFNALDTVLSFTPAKARLAYIESLSAVKFFISQYGLGALREVIEDLNQSQSLDQAFLNTTGFDVLDFEIKWMQYLSSEYKWLIVLNFDNLLWVTIGMLFLLALVIKRIRAKKTIKNWIEEDGDVEN
jgi:hypothetical protein